MQYKSIGVVIQGPLCSKGRHGITAFADDLTDESIVEFDCIEQISSYFVNYPEYNFVVSTWKSEDPLRVAELKSRVGEENVLLLDELDPLISNNRQPGFLINNKYKQIFSTKAGADELYKRGVEICVKLRTDQLLDLNLLVNDFLRVKARRKVDFMVPFFYKTIPDYYCDFFFVSEIDTMIKFCSLYFRQGEIFESVHCDLFYSVAQSNCRIPLILIRIFKRTSALRFYYKKVWSTVLSPSSKELINSLYWRGSRFNMQTLISNGGVFLDDMSPNYAPNSKVLNCKSTLTEFFKIPLRLLRRLL